MTSRHRILGASLSAPGPAPDTGWWTAQARAAEAAGLDFVIVESGPLDPLLLAARLAAQTGRIGIVAAAATTTTEPFAISSALATIDVIADGRAGWLAQAVAADVAAGTVTWEIPGDVIADAAEHVDAVGALWDSWEDGAEIRDAETDRFIDRSRVHHVHLRGAHLSVRGPSITPRPPQGHPLIAVRAGAEDARRLAAAGAEVLVTADPAAPALPGLLRLLEVSVAGAGAGPGVAALLDEHDAFDGFVLHADDLADTLATLVPELEARGVRPPPQDGVTTLRERLGLGPATNRFDGAAT